uniref:zinc finger HIT domain-containing protein 2 n=1 Tax=Pristiophorus japonicus TaxID=55135 RepID=UPI00398F1C8A
MARKVSYFYDPDELEEDRRSERVNEEQPVVDVEGTEGESDAEREWLSGRTVRDCERIWEQDDSIPATSGNIAPLLSLCSKPSPLIQYSVVNVLFAYAFSMKLINGDLSREMRDEFIEAVMTLSEALKGSRVFTSAAEALEAGVGAVQSGPYSSNPFEPVLTIRDTAELLSGESGASGGHYTLAAISQLGRVLGKDKRSRHGEGPERYRARKKCAFLLSWVNEHSDALDSLSLEVRRVYKNSFDTLLQVEEAKAKLEKAWGGNRPPQKKVLIEELTP